ncbi:hypothetical protein ACU635_50515 [[Actinomadura] parvosata]|uniref:hypothetical protein n=1 Tax=[Actinomadura] parvosata TaxID=1955412 RepID=UPI00406D30FC
MKHTRKFAAVAATALLGASLTLPAAPAYAWSCGVNPAPHCYGVANYRATNIDAYGLDLWTNCLHLDTPATRFATHETWYSAAEGFIETGFLRGTIGHQDIPSSAFRYFWGERYGSNTYSGHYISLAAVNTWVNFSMYRNTSGTWNIYVGGTLRGTTANAYGTTGWMKAGGESTDPLVYSNGATQELKSRNASTGSWSTASFYSYNVNTDVYSAQALTSNSMIEFSLNNMCTFAAANEVPAVKAPTDADVKAAALAFAKRNGDGSPAAIEAVETTRKRVAGNKGVTSDQPVITLQMKGDFTGERGAEPGGKPLKGTTLSVTLDEKTGEVTDWTLSSSPQDLKTLGSVKKL